MNKLGELLKQADALKSAAEIKGKWDEESAKKYEEILGQADEEKVRAQLENRHAELAAFATQSNGKSTVVNGFGREAAPMEGVIDGVGMDLKSADWELYPLEHSAEGERKLKVLKSGAYKDAFYQYIVNSTKHGSDWRYQMKGDAMKVLQEGVDVAGGFWVAPDVRSDLIKKMAATAVVSQDVYSFTVGSDMVTFPKVVYTTDNKYTSGVRFSWTAEAPSAAITEATNPAAGRIQIPVHVATAAIIVTRALIEDGQFDILGYASSLLGEAFGLGIEDALITGDGAGKPQGILSHANATVASSSGGMYVPSGTSAAVTWGGATATAFDSTKGLLGVEAALPQQYEGPAKWYFNKGTKGAIRAIQDTQGRSLWSSGDQYPSMANGYVQTLLGYPYRTAQFATDLAANSYSVIFGDLQGYYSPRRTGLSVQVFNEIRGLQDEVVLYARQRIGGQLVHDWKVKLLKAASS